MDFNKDAKYDFQGLRMKYHRVTACYIFFTIKGGKTKKFKIGSSNYDLIKEIKPNPLKEVCAKLSTRVNELEKKVKQSDIKFKQIEKFEQLRIYMDENKVSLTDILHMNLIHDKNKYCNNFYKEKRIRNRICHPKVDKIKTQKEFLKLLV